MTEHSIIQNSILWSVKRILGLEESYYPFDAELMLHINSALATLYQIGAGKKNFQITSDEETWEDFLGDQYPNANVPTYVGLKVKMIWDPPTSSVAEKAFESRITELESRISYDVDPGTSTTTTEETA